MVMTYSSLIYVDMRKNEPFEINFAAEYGFDSLKQVVANETHFFVVANKRDRMLGFYMFQIEIENPKKQVEYFMGWMNKTDINDVDVCFMDERVNGRVEKSIVVSFKMIGINTYNVFVLDLETRHIRYRHESFQLWESPIKGHLMSTNEFLTFNKLGCGLLSVGQAEPRAIVDAEGLNRIIHSLGELNYLRVETSNHLYFAC